VNSL